MNNIPIVHGACKLDSHADPWVAEPNCTILEYTDQVTNVSANSNKLDIMENIPIATAVTAYDDPTNGVTTITVLHQCLYLGDKIENTLLCPNQLRNFGIEVDDVPMHLAPNLPHTRLPAQKKTSTYPFH